MIFFFSLFLFGTKASLSLDGKPNEHIFVLHAYFFFFVMPFFHHEDSRKLKIAKVAIILIIVVAIVIIIFIIIINDFILIVVIVFTGTFINPSIPSVHCNSCA